MIRKSYIWTFLLAMTLALVMSCGLKKDIVQKNAAPVLEDAVLWEINHPNLQETSYLLGTIHYVPNEYYLWPDIFEDKFASCSQLALEIDLKEMQGGNMLGLLDKFIMKDDLSISDILSSEDYRTVSDFFNKMGLPLILFERLKPFFLYILTMADFNNMDSGNMKSYELELLDKSKKSNIPVVGLETIDYQISIFDSIPYKTQADMLVNAIKDKIELDGEVDEDLNTLFQAYHRQDLNAIYEISSSTDSTMMEYNELLIDNRNRDWISKIKSLIADQPTFIAVGAGHLAGPAGVIQLMRNEGYILKPVITNNHGSH
ncbi:TraB/GumN family protein [Membranihabitans marinus]|uniref:TraB/GumN family protein n=1 Tax=Membranihabitans marinus TaxID=1227546 RepID=UPI001F16EFCE|nr:TraB/GumN family protein [Membranihabitans marinus]